MTGDPLNTLRNFFCAVLIALPLTALAVPIGIEVGGILIIPSGMIVKGTLNPEASGTRDMGDSTHEWNTITAQTLNLRTDALIQTNATTRIFMQIGGPLVFTGQAADTGSNDDHIFGTSTVKTAGAGRGLARYCNAAAAQGCTALFRVGIDSNFEIVGTGTASARIGGNVNADSTGVGNIGASGPDDLQTYTLPTNSLNQSARGLRIVAYGTTANNANAKTVRLLFGGTTVITKIMTVSVAGTWKIEATVLRTGASAQTIYSEAFNNAGTASSSTDGNTIVEQAGFATATETETGTIVIKTQSTVSTADNDIISQGLIVDYL